jgi:hypothetical protein
VSSFSPDTTEKALEVENRRREIFRSLPADNPYFQDLPPLKLGDIKRSRYWYKKWGKKAIEWEREHGIISAIPEKKKRTRLTIFRMPKAPPLCGEEWLREHLNDYTLEDIETLGIEMAYNGKQLPAVSMSDKKGKVKSLIRSLDSALS